MSAVAEPYGAGIPAEDMYGRKQIVVARSGSARRAVMIDRPFAELSLETHSSCRAFGQMSPQMFSGRLL